jgi:hypothetical protein
MRRSVTLDFARPAVALIASGAWFIGSLARLDGVAYFAIGFAVCSLLPNRIVIGPRGRAP